MSKKHKDENQQDEIVFEDALPEDDLAAALDAAQKEAAEFRDKFLRLAAEMDNLRKRTARDVEDATKYGVTSAAKPFLSVVDNLDRALQSVPNDIPANLKTIFEGVRATQRDLHAALDKMGVVSITPKTGDVLNPHEHEVMFEVPTEEQPNGTIMQVLENGYKIHDRLLRAARVAVAKNSKPAEKAMDISA
jgi:molecular chaperone GrpE